jgi:hypothetical protein
MERDKRIGSSRERNLSLDEAEILETFRILQIETVEQRSFFEFFPESEEDSSSIHTTVWFRSPVTTLYGTHEVE